MRKCIKCDQRSCAYWSMSFNGSIMTCIHDRSFSSSIDWFVSCEEKTDFGTNTKPTQSFRGMIVIWNSRPAAGESHLRDTWWWWWWQRQDIPKMKRKMNYCADLMRLESLERGLHIYICSTIAHISHENYRQATGSKAVMAFWVNAITSTSTEANLGKAGTRTTQSGEVSYVRFHVEARDWTYVR